MNDNARAIVAAESNLRRSLAALSNAYEAIHNHAEVLTRAAVDAAITPPPQITQNDIYTVLRTGTDRTETLEAGHRDVAQLGGRAIRVDTWQFNSHPDGSGGMFTLYAITIVVQKDKGQP